MKSLDDFRNEVNATQDVMTGELNIGIVDNIIWDKEAPLSAVFRNFSSIASEVDLTLYVLSPDEIERRLIDGRLHIGIAPVMHELASLAYEPLFEELNYLYCGREHPLFDRTDSDISTAELMRWSVRNEWACGRAPASGSACVATPIQRRRPWSRRRPLRKHCDCGRTRTCSCSLLQCLQIDLFAEDTAASTKACEMAASLPTLARLGRQQTRS